MPLLLSLSLTRSLSKHVCRAVKKGQSEMLLCGGAKGGWQNDLLERKAFQQKTDAMLEEPTKIIPYHYESISPNRDTR